MMAFLTQTLAGLIGSGPAIPSKPMSIFMLVMAALFAVAAFSRGTRVRGAFSYGRGESVPINIAGRVFLFLAALTIATVALRTLMQ